MVNKCQTSTCDPHNVGTGQHTLVTFKVQSKVMYLKTFLLCEIRLQISDLMHSYIAEEVLEALCSSRVLMPVACTRRGQFS